MNKLITCIFLLTFMVNDIHGQAQTNRTVGAAGGQRTSTGFTEKLLKFFGISDSPSTLKGPGDEVTSGELWVADLNSRTTRALTSSAGWRSPVFLPGTKDVLALRGTDVVRLPSGSGEGKKLYSVDAIVKLVGVGRDDPGKVLILLRGGADGHPPRRVSHRQYRSGYGGALRSRFQPGSADGGKPTGMVAHLRRPTHLCKAPS